MNRLAIFLSTRLWELIIIGIFLILVGPIWGVVGSHNIGYISSQREGSYHIGTDHQTGNVYINSDRSSENFVALSNDFHPSISPIDIDKSSAISFVARID